MPTTNSNFVVITNPCLVGSTVQPAGSVVPMNQVSALQVCNEGYATPLDFSLTTGGLANAGFAKNGAAYLTLTGTTAITLDLTALAAATGVVVAGDSSFALWNRIRFYNTGAVDLVVSPGGSNPARLLLAGTTPTLTIPAGSAVTLDSLAGLVVDSTHKTVTITPTAGGTIGVCVGGA